jgi:succinyl-diaminopimelate desuccinylase
MRDHGLATTLLRCGTGAVVGLTTEIRGSYPGPRWVLNACLDTAPFGDEHAWTHFPTSGVIENGWMWGRGSADSKVAVAIFCHLASRLTASTEQLHGSLVLLFDLDEHTGHFGGARQYFEGPDAPNDIAGVIIGYPGMDKLVIGARGVYRAELRVHGTASHSGASRSTPNAIDKAAHLIQELRATDLPDGTSADFPLPGKLTVTAIDGGQGYSVTPDVCTLDIDFRTTPIFDDEAAATLLDHVTTRVDELWPDTRPTLVQLTIRWPAYALAADSRLRTTLLRVAHTFGVGAEPKIAGPSNIGNYLAGRGIAATAGFGVTYSGLHASDERIQLDTIPTIQAIYHATLLSLLTRTQ